MNVADGKELGTNSCPREISCHCRRRPPFDRLRLQILAYKIRRTPLSEKSGQWLEDRPRESGRAAHRRDPYQPKPFPIGIDHI